MFASFSINHLVLLTLYTTIVMLLLFGVTIFIHELGHFLVARWFGMRADVFSIGFGHAIWKRKYNGVLYKIGWIPFGGYVALPQMDPGRGKVVDDDGREIDLPWVAPWKKILVALAGPAGNVLLAVILSYIIFWVGKPSAPHEMSSLIGYVETNSLAYAAGVHTGDRIAAVEGKTKKRVPIANWQDFRIECALAGEVTLHLESSGGLRSVTLPTEKDLLGIREVAGLSGMEYCKVLSTTPGSSAAEAGVLPGDLIATFNGVEVLSIRHLTSLVDQHRDQAVPMGLERQGRTLELTVTPRMNEELGRALIGVGFNTFFMDDTHKVHPRPAEQMRQHIVPVLRILRAFVTPAEARGAAGSIGGPPLIFWSLWMIIQSSFVMALWFTSFLNINLVIINLLPVPILDGGHIVFALWELITRRPIHQKIVNGLSFVFASLLIALMLFLSYRDVTKLISLRRAMPDAPTNAAPANTP